MTQATDWTQLSIDALEADQARALYRQACAELMEVKKQKQKRLLVSLGVQTAFLALATFFLSSVTQYAVCGALAYTFTQTFNNLFDCRKCVKYAKKALQQQDISPEKARDGLKMLAPLLKP